MLDTHPHGKGLGFHFQPLGQQQAISVPGRMTDAKKYIIAGHTLLTIDQQSLYMPIGYFHIRYLSIEAHLTPQTDYFLTNVFHHAAQQICTDMRFMQIADFCRRSGCDKGLQNVLNVYIADSGGELAIGKSACAALAKLNIGAFVQCPCLPKPFNSRLPAVHITAPFQHQWLPAGFSQSQSRKHTSRAKAYDHRPHIARRPLAQLRFLTFYRLDLLQILIPAELF